MQPVHCIQNLTDISWIGALKEGGEEAICYTKRFHLDRLPDFAAIRLDSKGVCAVFLNGQFLESSCGRYHNRIMYVECTSALQNGENTIKLVHVGHYFQSAGIQAGTRRGGWFSAVAAQLEMRKNGQTTYIATNETWQTQWQGKTQPATVFSQVTNAEYQRFWLAAALYAEPKQSAFADAITDVVGSEYLAYRNAPQQKDAYPESVLQTQIDENGWWSIYGFGRLHVGYLAFAYTAQEDGEMVATFDYNEAPTDLTVGAPDGFSADVIRSLIIRIPLQKGTHSVFIPRRRAFRYLKLATSQKDIQIRDLHLHLSMLNDENIGWFHCDDALLNEIWETGKYTLLVNKHQEYESCPRNEMKFFSGDGIIDALVDYYTFGNAPLVDASLSLTEAGRDSGLRWDIYDNSSLLWDYPAWRIIMFYNHTRYFTDTQFIERYFEEMATCLAWMIAKTNRNGLIYQYPIPGGSFNRGFGPVDYGCSMDRLGERPYLNALLYQSLRCMSDLAEKLHDARAKTWSEMADRVYDAFNQRLWSEEQGAYIDTYDTAYVPQDGNALALLFGLADERRAAIIMQTLRDKNWSPYGSTMTSAPTRAKDTLDGAYTISPPFCTYEAEARFLLGDADGALQLIKNCWGTMLRKGAKTFWEYAPNHPTDCWQIRAHAWSAGCTYLLSAYVLGIRPQTAGYDEILFQPSGNVDSFKGVVPTPHGEIAIRCETVDGKKHYTLAIPHGIPLKTQLPEHATLQVIEYEQ